nr:hypothetical protein [uncultured bacterium]
MTTSIPLTIPEILEARAGAFPENVSFRVDGRVLTYAEWNLRSRSVAHGLLAAGCEPGTRVALLFDGLDWLSYAVAYLAVLRCGAVAIHLNGHIPDAEMQRRLDECGATWVIRSSFLSPPRGFTGRSTTLRELSSGNTAPVPVTVSPESIADIRYTSGTTGPAKAYSIPHANLTFGRTLDGMKTLSRSATMLVPMTLGSSTGATVLTVGLTSPSTLVLCSPLDVERMGELIQSERVDSVMITPHIANQLIDARLGERYDLSSVRLFATASAPLPPAHARRLLALVPGAMLQIACAQSEASPALMTQTYVAERPFSVGKPSAITELRVVGPDGSERLPGQLGEIWLRTPAPKRLFLNAPKVNELLLADGWHRTGDLGFIDSHGELHFFDRQVDALSRKGQLVSSVALEAMLLEHPSVREASVVGVSREDGDHHVTAFVVLREPGALRTLKEHCARHVPPEHCPDQLISIEALPRTHNGKVLKRHLRLALGRYDPFEPLPGHGAGSQRPEEAAANKSA